MLYTWKMFTLSALCSDWKKDRMVNIPHSALPVPKPEIMENSDGQTPES